MTTFNDGPWSKFAAAQKRLWKMTRNRAESWRDNERQRSVERSQARSSHSDDDVAEPEFTVQTADPANDASEAAPNEQVHEPGGDVPLYEDFDSFLKIAIGEYYVRYGKLAPMNFASLLMASGVATSMAADGVKSGDLPKRALYGAAGVLALRYGLKYAMAGPLGLVATAASLYGLGKYLITHRKTVLPRARQYRSVILEVRNRFQKVEDGHVDGRFDNYERDVMYDGLMRRLLDDLVAIDVEFKRANK